MAAVASWFRAACMAPQRVCPQTMMFGMPSPFSPYSMVAASADGAIGLYGATMFPALRTTNRSPGSAWQIRSGTIRLSEQPMKRACGRCPATSFWKKSRRAANTSSWNRWMPLMSFCMVSRVP